MAGQKPISVLERARHRLRTRLQILALLLGAVLTAQSCTIEVAAPPETGFLAVLFSAQGATQIVSGMHYVMRIRELSGTYNIDHRFRVSPNDTVVRAYPLATYVITVDSVPLACSSRIGNAQEALISEPGNTAITRFHYECNTLLGLTVLADGFNVDSSYVWTATGPGGRQQFGVADAADTVRITDISAGEYTVELGHIASNCVLISDGWRKQTIVVNPPMTGSVHFRIRCSNLARSPHVIHFASSFDNGVSGFYAEVVETNAEDGVGTYAWNISDCLGNVLFRGAGYIADALRYDRTAGEDTARIVVTVPLPDPAADVARACTAVRFEDLEGNTTHWVEERSRNETGRPPVADVFKVVLDGGLLRTTLSASDPDNDLAGAFMTITFRDGSQISPANGRPDVRPFNVVGYLPPFKDIPYLLADGTRFQVDDVLSVNVDLIDRAGNMTRAVDTNFSQ